ncbi:MAG: cytochrome c-type biogenesis protein [Dongiaceae bacterium]
MRRRIAICFALMVAAAWLSTALAVEPGEMLGDPALEARARAISRELRCLVCQNQSIDDSNADLARDLRLLVRERLQAGDKDQEVRQFLVARYGEFILLRPSIGPATYALWFGPAVMLVLALVIIRGFFQRQKARPRTVDDLTPEERRRIQDLLVRQGDNGGGRSP